MDKPETPPSLRDDYVTEETKTFISSLPSVVADHSPTRLYNYQGCWYYPNTLQGILNFQRSFKPQETDVILASYPKSGTTWLKALTLSILERSKHHPGPDHPLLSDNPHALVPFLESILYIKSTTPDLTKYSSPRLFSTHMTLHTLQEGLADSPCKIVYVCRNIKDVLVSLWYFISAFREIEVDKSFLETLCESYCSGVGAYGPFWEHVLSYWRGSLKDPNHVLFLRYEELKTEPHAQVKRLAEFLGCPFTEEEEQSGSIDKILELCSLRNLGNLEVNKTGKTLNKLPHHSFFRKGEVGDSKNHLTPEMEDKIDKIIEEKYKGSGLKF